jgi:menaquinone-dependent protoporphyrinogen oxidase
MTTLVAFASEHGSTKEIAQKIASRLHDKDIGTQCRPIEGGMDLAEFQNIVIGSAVHAMHWLPQAEKFLYDHKSYLKTVPVWAFSVSYPAGIPHLMATKHPEEKEEVILDKYVEKLVQTKKHELLPGRLEKDHFTPVFGWFYSMVGGHYGDAIDWAKVEKFADEVAEGIQQRGKTAK